METVRIVNVPLDQLEASIERLLDKKLAKLAQPKKVEDEKMNVEGVAKYLMLKVKTIYQKTSSRTIPHHKEGSRPVFFKSEIDEWNNKRRRKVRTQEDFNND